MNNTPSNISNTTRFRTFVIRQQEAQVFGTDAASVLGQIRYWTDPSRSKNYREGRYWVYNSLSDWHQQFVNISQRTLRRIFESLENMGVLIVKKYNAWRRDQRKWHSVDFEKLAEILRTFPIKSSRRKRGKDPDPDQNNETSQEATLEEKESTQTEENPKVVSGSDIKTGGNLDVANLATCRIGQSGHIYTESSLEMISPPTPNPDIQDLSREMINIWNKEVEQQAGKVSLSFWRQRALKKALQHHFQSSLNEWKQYCLLIAHNSFLMGEGPNKWKATLDWALRVDNIHKVKERSYTGQKEISKPSEFDRNSIVGSDSWKKICEQLCHRLGYAKLISWFVVEGIHFQKEETSHPQLQCPTRFIRDWIESHYRYDLEWAIKQVLPHVQQVEICL